ncbi:MAG TPA: bifunctional serine/threonine-protein kinase/formylglycine-generating enzyme family protein, partial [Bryobacteraceae bacterium]|nr:bifunctional serine/threonine-protein kinase/formylglycine-generating enzyme family protein [Bryobacteraceae bacterium]
QFDRYECRQDLGGGMTDVYRAWDSRLHREVVVKILRPDAAGQEDMRQRFLREARLACRCRHENVVVTFDAGEFEGRPYMVMEFMEGRPLSALIQSGELTGSQQILRIAYELAGAFEHVHSLDIIHRDIKPANIWIEPSGRSKVLDFGIAKTPDLSYTSVDLVFGTLPYMAPEQLMGKPVSKSVDIYAFGATIFEMFTRRRLVSAATVEEVYGEILAGAENAVSNAVEIPDSVKPVLARCLNKDPEQRYANFSEVRSAFSLLQSQPATEPGLAWAAPGEPAQTSSRPAWLLPVVGLVLLTLVGAALWFALIRRPEPASSEASESLPAVLSDPAGDMRLIPAGDAVIGPDRRRVPVATFYMDQTEVSNGVYIRFARSTGRPVSPEQEAAEAQLPVTNISFDDAAAFAKWANKRLPTAVEWEKAARGREGKPFPWGDAATHGRANIPSYDGEERSLLAVSSLAEGDSSFGIRNLIGNVWEWVDASGQPDPDHFKNAMQLLPNIDPPLSPSEPFHQIRGGSYRFYVPKDQLSSLISDYSLIPARGRAKDVGFRCARSAGAQAQEGTK